MFFDIHAHMYKYPYPTENGKFLMSTPEQVGKRYKSLVSQDAPFCRFWDRNCMSLSLWGK